MEDFLGRELFIGDNIIFPLWDKKEIQTGIINEMDCETVLVDSETDGITYEVKLEDTVRI